MSFTMIRHRVEDFARWRAAFDSNEQWRRANGEMHYYVFTDADDSNRVTLLQEWVDLEHARRFIANPELQEKMRQSGVSEQPEVHYLNEIESSYKQ